MYIKDWCEKVGNILNSLRFISTETIEVTKSADGYEFRVKDLPTETSSISSSNSQPDAYPCIITGGSTQGGYTVAIYANGFDKPTTGSGILHVLDLALADNVPSGTRIMGHKLSVSITGSIV